MRRELIRHGLLLCQVLCDQISDILLGVRDLEVMGVLPFLFAALTRGRDCHRNYVLRYLFINNTLTFSRILRAPSL